MYNEAIKAARNSKDPSTKVGCVIVGQDNEIVSSGCNGMVSGSDEKYLPFVAPMKYRVVVHAEMNAIISAKQNLEGCTMYVTDAPCEQCLKHILQAGIRTVYYGSTAILKRWNDKEGIEAIKNLLLSMSDANVVNWYTMEPLSSELGL